MPIFSIRWVGVEKYWVRRNNRNNPNHYDSKEDNEEFTYSFTLDRTSELTSFENVLLHRIDASHAALAVILVPAEVLVALLLPPFSFTPMINAEALSAPKLLLFAPLRVTPAADVFTLVSTPFDVALESWVTFVSRLCCCCIDYGGDLGHLRRHACRNHLLLELLQLLHNFLLVF